MRKREEGHEHLTKLEKFERTTNQHTLEGDQNHLSHVWQTMISVKESIENSGKLQDYLSEMLHLFLADSVDLNQ